MTGISAIFRTVAARTKKTFQYTKESIKDVWAAFAHPEAMTPQMRRLDEFKLLAGGLISGAGAAELNPLVVAGGAIPTWEAYHDMEHAGHVWRNQHENGCGAVL